MRSFAVGVSTIQTDRSQVSEADWRGTIRNNIKKVYWPGLAMILLFIALSTHWPLRKAFFQTDDFIWLRLELAEYRRVVRWQPRGNHRLPTDFSSEHLYRLPNLRAKRGAVAFRKRRAPRG